ncbi:MAG: hypothetical protein QG556_752 [Pseudomonadota bacterium]|nr:hypothetical protein [Pseudomonadota bacterium]
MMLKILNKILGAVLLTVLGAPFIALSIISRLLNFIDFLYQGEIKKALLSIVTAPLYALLFLLVGLIFVISDGWDKGLVNHILAVPKNIRSFFEEKLFFGTQKNQSIKDLFIDSSGNGLDKFVTSGFWGLLTLKWISLCFSNEIFLSHNAKTNSPHNAVHIYFTQLNLDILLQKYLSYENKNSMLVSREIQDFLQGKLKEIQIKYDETKTLGSVGKSQSALDELQTIKAAQRCFEYFINNNNYASDLGSKFSYSASTVLNLVWLAIQRECPTNQEQLALQEKLIWTLFQIQRGFNIISNGDGEDMPECPGGAIGLLVRVICDENELMPNSEYKAGDPTLSNLSLALKNKLDEPFKSSSSFTTQLTRKSYSQNPPAYKQKVKENITQSWKLMFQPLIESGAMQSEDMQALIDAGIEDWEPPTIA